MAKKVRMKLTYSGKRLWWSTDGGVNWGPVGPQSPVMVLNPRAEVHWKGDKTIDELSIVLESDKVMDTISGSKTLKKGKVRSNCKNGDQCKYTIVVVPTGTAQRISVDPDMKICDPPCPPVPHNP